MDIKPHKVSLKGVSLSGVSLKGPNDWYRWISILRKYAVILDIWDQIDPKRPTKAAIQRPEIPKPSDIDPEAVHITDLSDGQLQRLEALKSVYDSNLVAYQMQQEALLVIQQYIISTVGKYLYTIATAYDVPRQLELLQARLQPTSWELERESEQDIMQSSRPQIAHSMPRSPI